MPALAGRLGTAPVAATVQMTIRARELRAAGAEVIPLTIGEPDFATPLHAIEAGYKAALAGQTKYPPQDGTPALKEAVRQKFRRENNLDFAPEQIMVGNGGKQVLYDAVMATVDPGDEVVIPYPCWTAYPLMTKLAGGIPVPVSCPENNGFKLRAEDLEAAITPRTKLLILNLPNNPTGAACTKSELIELGAVIRRNPHLWVVADDMYEHLVYDEDFSLVTLAAAVPDIADRVVTIAGVSKTYAMTGWRIGFAGGPRTLIKAMVNMQGQVTAGVSTVGQAAAVAALEGPQDLVAERRAIYRRRRDLVVSMLNEAPGITCRKPEGAFYVYPNIGGCIGRTSAAGRRIETDQDFALALLEEAHVAVVHGAAFGMSPYLRISYATDETSLAEACRRIGEFTAGLR
ncbi:MAG TPA: pyridoxal phosphate-dependent aminotransferase [Acetobacteraceae bacterium]|nr:pyridoxal phosphate-dependent aminotransferase [Acetobacteraceae bacterium]